MRNISHLFLLSQCPIIHPDTNCTLINQPTCMIVSHGHQIAIQLLKASKQLSSETNVIGRARIQYPFRRVWMTIWWCNRKWKVRRVRIITVWSHDIGIWSWLLSSIYWALDNHFFSVISLYRRHTNSFSICDYQPWASNWISAYFSSSIWTTFSRGQYLCWCVTGRKLLILPPQFEIHKSSDLFLVAKGCSLIDQCKNKGLISLIRERTQLY